MMSWSAAPTESNQPTVCADPLVSVTQSRSPVALSTAITKSDPPAARYVLTPVARISHPNAWLSSGVPQPSNRPLGSATERPGTHDSS